MNGVDPILAARAREAACRIKMVEASSEFAMALGDPNTSQERVAELTAEGSHRVQDYVGALAELEALVPGSIDAILEADRARRGAREEAP